MNKKTNPSEHSTVVLSSILILAAFSLRDFAYFRDYSIVFEGAYRLSLGQIPFVDFFSPVGPGAFIFPAVLFKIFSPNWIVLLYSQLIFNLLHIILFSSLLKKIKVKPAIHNVSIILFTLLYLVFQTHSWYNSTATLLLFLSIRLALNSGYLSVTIAAIACTLGVLTKQDFGLLAFLINAVLIYSANSDLTINKIYDEHFPLRDFLFTKKNLKLLAVFLIVFGISLFLFIILTNAENFLYWFNYGQAHQDTRTLDAKILLGYPYGLFSLFIAILAFAHNNKRLLISAIFLAASSTTKTTSGLYFTHYYFIGFLPVILHETVLLKIRLKPIIFIFLIFTSYRVIRKPIVDFYNVADSIATQTPEHFIFDRNLITGPISAFPNEFSAFSPKTSAPQETIELIKGIKSQKIVSTTTHENLILNISELTPIYAEVGVPPPTNLPLWFHSNISFFGPQINDLNKILASERFEMILIQGTHEGLSETYTNFIQIINKNKAYRLVKEITETPSNFTWPCKPYCEGSIYFYQKNNLIN